MSTAQAATIHHRRRTANRPRASKLSAGRRNMRGTGSMLPRITNSTRPTLARGSTCRWAFTPADDPPPRTVAVPIIGSRVSGRRFERQAVNLAGRAAAVNARRSEVAGWIAARGRVGRRPRPRRRARDPPDAHDGRSARIDRASDPLPRRDPPSPSEAPRDDLHDLVPELPEQLRDPARRLRDLRQRSSSSSPSPPWSPRAAARAGSSGSRAPTRRSCSRSCSSCGRWCSAIGLQLVPHEGASSPYGGLGLIALFTGFFIIMGLTWSVIGD